MPPGRGYPRAWRVNELLRQVLADEIERISDADERLRLVTVTSVDVSPDLKSATVYFGSLAAPVEEALEERRLQLQRAMARQVRLKRTPKLKFLADPAVATGERVEEILRKLRMEHGAPRRAEHTVESGSDDQS